MGGPEDEGGEHKTPGPARRPRRTQVCCSHLEAHIRMIPKLKNPGNRETIKNNPRLEVLPPQAFVATKNQSGACSGTLSEGENIIGGHLHHPDGHHDEEGVVHPRG